MQPADRPPASPGEPHVCRKSDVCTCYSLALEPKEDCPVHGVVWPPRCGDCGKFMRWPAPISEGGAETQ